MEAHRDAGLLRGRPHRVPVRVRERRLAVVLGLVAEVHRAVTELDAALQLADREVDVPERDRGDREQPLGIGAAPVVEEVVVRAHALRDELGVAEAQEVAVPEAADVRVEHLRADALAVEEREPGVGVVHRVGDLVERLRDRHRHDAVEPGHGVVAGVAEALAAGHPHVVAVDALDVRHDVVQRRRHARDPRVGRLGEVGVDVDDGDAVEEIGWWRWCVMVRSQSQGVVPIRSSASRAAISSAERPRSVRISWLCWPEHRRRGAEPAVDAGVPERQRRVRLHADDRVVEVLVVAAGDELRVLAT